MILARSLISKLLTRPLAQRFSHTTRAFYATPTAIRQVQTPIQTLPKDKVASGPLAPETGSTPVQTPIQSQAPSQVAPGAQPASRAELTQPRPLLYMTFGLTGVAVFSYFWYQHRKEHMERKWAAMQEEARQNVKNKS